MAQSPESHLDYLHQWSRDLDTPILSVDYSLAPEAAYEISLRTPEFLVDGAHEGASAVVLKS